MAHIIKDIVEWYAAGENLTANDAVYVSDGTGADAARTAGRVYKLDVTNSDRNKFAGIVKATVTTGNQAKVVVSGRLLGWTSLPVGKVVYASLTVPGSYQTTEPAAGEQHQVIGFCASATVLITNGALAGSFTTVPNAILKNSLAETSDPTVNDDSGDGFAVGSLWYNQTNNTLFIAEDVTSTAAVWQSIGGSSGGSSNYVTAIKTSDYTITTGDSEGNPLFSTKGATGKVVLTLPAAAADQQVTIVNGESEEVEIVAASGDKINTPSLDSVDSITTSIKGQAVQLVSIDGTDWVATFVEQEWFQGGIRGLFSGGRTTGSINVIEYVQIDTLSNTADFGDLTVSRFYVSACASNTRGVIAGGDPDSYPYSNVIDYVTIATVGNATDFGDLTVQAYGRAGAGSNTRGLIAGGSTISNTNVIEYITIASVSNSIDFGDLTVARVGIAGAASPTRAVWAGGNSGAVSNVIDYSTISTLANATDFGDLTQARQSLAGCSSSARAVWSGGYTSTHVNTMDYNTIATLGNSADFGDLTIARFWTASTSSQLRGLIAGGDGASLSNVIDYITIASPGNATDFGDLSAAKKGAVGLSNGHGGISA